MIKLLCINERSFFMLKIIAIVVVATIIGIVAMNFIPALSGGGGGGDPTQIVDDPNKLTIGITGQVVKPGNYILEPESNLQDLIDKAGKVEIKSNSNLKLKTSSESSCNCSTTSDWCSHWIGQQECSNSWSCDESGHCGTLFQYTCDGLCSLAI